MSGGLQRIGHLVGQLRLARARLALDEQRALQRDGGIDGDPQIVGGNIFLGTFKTAGLHGASLDGGSPHGRGMGPPPQGPESLPILRRINHNGGDRVVRLRVIGDKFAPMMEAASADTGKQVRDLLQDALNHLNRADFAKGEDALLHTLDQHPDEPDALQLLGVLRRAQGKIPRPRNCSAARWTLRPDQPHVQHNLGNLLRIDGRHDEGIAALREAIRLKANYADAWFNLGLAYYGKGALEEAEKAYRQALSCSRATRWPSKTSPWC